MFLTPRQKELYEFLVAYRARHGYAPTLEEIRDRFQLRSLGTVHRHLANLEEKGAIRRRWNYSRSIEIVASPTPGGAVELPLVGTVAAGRPIEALEQDDTLSVPETFVGRGPTFVLRVRGESMIGEGIRDGDFLVVEERVTAEDGETVIALLGGEATVKRFLRGRGEEVRLLPANPSMEPIVARADEVTIRGVVVAVLRKY